MSEELETSSSPEETSWAVPWGKLYLWKKESLTISSSSPASLGSKSPVGSCSAPLPRFLGTSGAEYARDFTVPGRAEGPVAPARLSRRGACMFCALFAFSLRFEVCSCGAVLELRAA